MVLAWEDAGEYDIACSSSHSSIVSVQSSEPGKGVKIKARKKGSAVITGTLGEVSFRCAVAVTDPKLKKEYGFYEKNKSFTLKVTGLNKASAPKWEAEDGYACTVSDKGKVRTKKIGSEEIYCHVDGKTLTFYLAVSTKTAVKAMRYGFKQIGKKKYSQALRMSRNYYDCSSFVYRIYRHAGKYLVSRSSWAPVAADIGHYYVKRGKRIKARGRTYDEEDLQPGDLICWGGSHAARNGRYKRIYHISLYIGNGKTLESSSTYNNVVIRERSILKKSQIPVVVRP